MSIPAACVASVLLCGASVAPGAAAAAAGGGGGGGTAGKGPQKGKMPGGKPGNMPGATGEETEQNRSLPTIEQGPNMYLAEETQFILSAKWSTCAARLLS